MTQGRVDDGPGLVSIGDFSRMTYLTVKALRHYQDVGVLEPASVDPSSGYRSYRLDQVPLAQVIRRLRDLGMPLDDVRSVVEAPDLEARNRAIAEHLARMEDQLSRTRDTVRSLRSLLEAPSGRDRATRRDVTLRSVPAQWVLAVEETVPMATAAAWAGGAFGELHAALDRLSAADPALRRDGVDGALFHDDFFTADAGVLVAYVPVTGPIDGAPSLGAGRVTSRRLPAVELAEMVHEGSGTTIDETYAELGAVVAERAIGVAGPIRESFVVTAADTAVESDHRTVVGWPIFRTRAD